MLTPVGWFDLNEERTGVCRRYLEPVRCSEQSRDAGSRRYAGGPGFDKPPVATLLKRKRLLSRPDRGEGAYGLGAQNTITIYKVAKGLRPLYKYILQF